MRTRRPVGVTLIALFYVWGAGWLLLSLVTNPQGVGAQLALRHGLPAQLGLLVLPTVIVLALAIAFGLLSLSRWGYTLTMVYLLYFGSVNLALLHTGETQVARGSVGWACCVLVYLWVKRRIFVGPTTHRPDGNGPYT